MTSRFAIVLALAACGGGRTQPNVPSNTEPTTPSTPERPPAAGHMREQRDAIARVDEANPRSVDHAIKAADALGEARFAGAIDELGALAMRPPSKKLLALQIAAIRALGRMTGDKPRAVGALAKVIEREPPQRPRDKTEEEPYFLHLSIVGAAVNATSELEDKGTAALLVPVMYKTPELTMQVRRALASTGSAGAAEARKIIRGEHAAIDALIRDKKLDRDCPNGGPCLPLSMRDYFAAIVIGDLRDASAVPDLLAALQRPALPPWVIDNVPAANSQHAAIFDALRKIGAPESAAPLRALWTNPKSSLEDRTLAIGAYAFAARDQAGVDELWKIAADNAADDGLRVEAATAFARLASDKQRIAVFGGMAKKYTDASAKKRAAADKLLAKKQAADNVLAKAKDALDAAKTKLIALTQDQSKTADEIRAGTAATKRVEADYKDAKSKHRAQTAEWTQHDNAAKAYVGYARMFQTHVARVEIAARCADNLDCYAKALSVTATDAVQAVKPFLPDVDKWTDDEKQGLVDATVDRAALELGKRAATAKLDVVLDALASENRVIREAVLNALPRLAPTPCPACVSKLDAAIEAGRTKTYLAAVQFETQVMRNYLTSR